MSDTDQSIDSIDFTRFDIDTLDRFARSHIDTLERFDLEAQLAELEKRDRAEARVNAYNQLLRIQSALADKLEAAKAEERTKESEEPAVFGILLSFPEGYRVVGSFDTNEHAQANIEIIQGSMPSEDIDPNWGGAVVVRR